jgi:hypothetical protein
VTLPATFSNIALGTANAQGQYVVQSPEYEPTAVGRYQWVASYSGDTNNKAVSTPCNDTGEQSVVNKAQSSISTEQSWVPSDKAILGQTGGTVKFTLLMGVTEANCLANTYNQGDPGFVYTSGALSVTDTTAPIEVSTTSAATQPNPVTTTAATPGDQYRWKVEYSGTSAFNAVTTCKEITQIFIDNGTQVTG